MLDVSSRKRNGRLVVSKYNSRYMGTRQSDLRTGKCNIAICCMFRYANRYDFIVRPSDCTPGVILPSLLSLGFLFFLLFVRQTEPSCCSALRQRRRRRWWRQQKISNKSFRNPASLLSASPDFHYLAFMPPPYPPKTLPLFSSVPLPSCQERFYNSTISICLFPAFPI